MNLQKLFEQVGFHEEIHNNKNFYTAPGHSWYYAEDEGYYLQFYIYGSWQEEPKGAIRLYRIVSDEEIGEVLIDAIHNYEKNGPLFFRPEVIFENASRYVRRMVGKPLTETALQGLCNLYDYSVQAGYYGWKLTYECKEVLQMITLKGDTHILPELHQRLMNLPDVYFDFLFGMENNLHHYPKRQSRLLEYMKVHPELRTTDIIILTSLMNENDLIPEGQMEQILDCYHENTKFFAEDIKDQDNEITREQNKFDWKITTFISGSMAYTLRHSGPILFIDHMEHCVAYVILVKKDDTTAELLKPCVLNEKEYPGVREKLLDYMERVARKAGFIWLETISLFDEEDFFERNGFHLKKEAVKEENSVYMTKKIGTKQM